MFDFCETLIDFQTADRYVDYCRRHMKTIRMSMVHSLLKALEKVLFFKAINRIRRNNNIHKRFVLWQMKGLKRTECERMAQHFFEEELMPNVIPETIGLLRKHQEQKDQVWIISGGYDVYIEYFAKYYQIERCICSHIQFDKSDVCTGKMEGLDCMRLNKVRMLESALKEHPEITHVTVYSDSFSDLPLFLRANNAVVISKGKHQDWIDQYQLKEIIWS